MAIAALLSLDDHRRPMAAARETVRLGMPHLAYRGLSETWLLKTLGHTHWSLLARLAGRRDPDFRDAAGDPVYAAFCIVSIQKAAFADLAAGDEIVIASEAARVSRTQFASRHAFTHGGRSIGTVELASVFVKRMDGRNRSIARVALDGFPSPARDAAFTRAADLAAVIRAGRWNGHFGFLNAAEADGRSITVSPCPAQDFNGAGLLYFAAFQTFVDRAEWCLFGPEVADLVTTARDIVFHGNADIGDDLVVTLRQARQAADSLAHWFTIGLANGTPLATIFTERRRQGMVIDREAGCRTAPPGPCVRTIQPLSQGCTG